MRRSIRNTPDGSRAQRQGEAADEGPAHERELLKGADHGIDERHRSAFGHGPAASSQDSQSWRARIEVRSRQDLRRSTPSDRLAGKKKRFRKVLAHQIQIMQSRHDRAPLAMPAQDELQQVGRRPHVDGRERLVQQDQLSVLQQHAREQHPLKLAARQRSDRPLLEPVESDGRESSSARASRDRPTARNKPISPHSPRQSTSITVIGKLRSISCLLRQVSDVAATESRDPDIAVQRLQRADDAFQQRRLAGAIGSDDRGQRPFQERAIQVMDGRMPIVAEREVGQPDHGGRGDGRSDAVSHDIAHRTASQRTVAAAPA